MSVTWRYKSRKNGNASAILVKNFNYAVLAKIYLDFDVCTNYILTVSHLYT